MKILNSSILAVLVVAVAACGGQADDGGRDNGRVGGNKDSDAGAAADDDEEGSADDDDADDDDDDADDDDDDDADDDGDDDNGADDDNGGSSGSGGGSTMGGGPGGEPVMNPDAPVATPDDPTSTPGVAPPMSMPGSPPIIVGPGMPAEPPTNCSPSYQLSEVGYCQVDLACDNDYVYTYCYDQGSEWYCDCGTNYTYTSYQLTGVEGDVCALASEVCAQTTEPDFAEPVCMPSYESVYDGYCDKSISCSQTATLDGGGTVTSFVSQYGYCQDDGSGTLNCQCSGSNQAQFFSLTGSNINEGCDKVIELCNAEVEVEFTEPEVCSLDYQYEGTDYCEMQQRCARSAPVSEGVVAESVEYESAFCQAGVGTSACNCSSPNRYLSFQLEAAYNSATTCDSALDICASDEPIEPSGPVSCSRSSQYGGNGSCDTSYQCTQSAQIAGVSVGVYGNIYAYCTLSMAGEYACTCSSGSNSVQLQVSAADDWTACTDVGPLCEQAVEVAIGNEGGVIIGPGIPAPPRPIPLR